MTTRSMRVSVIICNYNHGRFVERAIESALNQDYRDVEVVVVDDGSTDNSRAAIQAYGAAIVTVFQENGGQISAYNAGYAACSGEVVIFLDADDLLLPGALSGFVEGFQGGVVKVHAPMLVVDEHGDDCGVVVPRTLASGDVSGMLRGGQLYASAPGSGNAYLRSALDQLMPLLEDGTDRHGADFYTIYGVSMLGDVRPTGDVPLACYRLHEAEVGGVGFGNAAQERSREPESSQHRYQQLRRLLHQRLGRHVEMAPRLRDFSLEKQGYARVLTGGRTYSQRLREGAPYLMGKLWPAIRVRPSTLERGALLCWGLVTLVAPQHLSRPLLRYVCNPASR